MKANWKPGTMVYPLPVVMVSCGGNGYEPNLITVAWTGTVCTDPAMCYISVRKSRHSYEIIEKTGEFVINLTSEKLAKATDWCGVKSGRDVNKWKEMGLTPGKSKEVSAPTLEESPVNIECRVKESVELGSHVMFVAEVVNVQADEQYLDPETGAFDMGKAKLIAYSHGHYYKLGEKIGKFGWSVERKKKKQ